MAKKKKQPEPIIYPGIPLPLDHPEIPEAWLPVDDFSSHRPMLYRAIMNTAHTSFVEFGTGYGSTQLLASYYEPKKDKELLSYENNHDWFLKMANGYFSRKEFLDIAGKNNHTIFYDENLLKFNLWKGSIVFVDCAPAELRKELICKHAGQAKIIIVHDTEPGAEYVYGVAEILNSFKYRCDLIVEGSPQTTAVSNLYEFTNWKTYVNDTIQFV